MTIGDLEYRCDPARAALVIVDMQVDFCNPTGATSGEAYDAMSAMVDRTNALVDQAHRSGVPVIFIRTQHDDSTNTEAWLLRNGSTPRDKEKCVTGSDGAEFYGVKPLPEDIVVTKYRYSGFVCTDLEMILRRLGRTAIVCTGVATNCCVQLTASHALCLDLHVTVVADCCSSSSVELHDAALRSMARSIGLVASSDDVARLWAAHPDRRFDPTSDVLGRPSAPWVNA